MSKETANQKKNTGQETKEKKKQQKNGSDQQQKEQPKKEEQEESSAQDEITEEEQESSAQEGQAAEEEEKSQEEILKEEVEEYKEKANQMEEKYLRLLAEFNNYKKRTQKDREEFAQLANKDLMIDLLPVLDDMERGEQSIEEAEDIESVKEGLQFIFQKLKKALEDKGLQQMKSVGEPFDPDYHEAVSNLEVEEEEQKGTVIDEVQKGYLLNDKIIRHAKVVVGE